MCSDHSMYHGLIFSQAVTSGATDVTIVSTDKDLAQLVTRRVSMLNCYTGERLGPDEVTNELLLVKNGR